MELESRISHLYGPEEVVYGPDELVVVCLVRDGRPYLKSFVEHYFSLGVKHIVFLDNGSTDGTVEALEGYRNVTVLQTEIPFEGHLDSLRRYLVTRFGGGRWILCVDVDELFDYPYSDVVSLSSFLGYLTEKSYTAVVAQVLDMFPKEPAPRAATAKDEPPKERHRFYDVSNIVRQGYYAPGDATNTLANEEIEVYRDGIRRTVFGQRTLLTKHPLVFLDDEIRPMHPTVHWVDRARIADVTGVLFRYGSAGDFEPGLRRETTQELGGVDDLVDNQFLVVSGDYLAQVDVEERKGASDDGELRRLIEAFSRASARARTQARVARVLQGQIDRLEDRLERERRRAKTVPHAERRRVESLERRNRNLERQMKDIQGSKSWKLLGKLGRIRARILRKP